MWGGVGFLWVVVWVALCTFALVRGRKVERVVALAFLLDEIVVLAFPRVQPVSTIRLSYLLGDLAVLAVLFWALIASSRLWPAVTLGLQGLSVVTQLAKLMDVTLAPWGYYTASYIWGFAALAALTVGVARDPRSGRARGDGGERSAP